MTEHELSTTAVIEPDVDLQEIQEKEEDGVSDTTSLMSSILQYRHENGRTYHAYKDGSYVLPNDPAETERLDLQHNLLVMTFGGKLHLSSLQENVRRVLDAGCGTGIWAVDFAEEHPETQVTGIDLSPSQPSFIPPNVTFYVDDLEDDWTFSQPFDFIFTRFMTGSIQDWPKYFKRCYDNLTPEGTLEVQDILYPMNSDDNTFPPESPLRRWSELLAEAFAATGRPMNSALKYKEQLAEAGFTDIVDFKAKWPQNGWPRDSKHKQIGLWAYENAQAALEALSLAVLTRPKNGGGLGWKVEDVHTLLAGVRKDLKDVRIHAYWPMYAIYARKPVN
ncbi:S-adenosyl-L-methionine-dependent methyltransferase [Cladorrhinum sp. PSN259]|nr:S-adenosyl-L-methionine-dependent methyltransferase [Cladorrhinum sp. PSN259]